jgi:hypothetical protein
LSFSGAQYQRATALKIHRGQPHAGSSPALGTNKIKGFLPLDGPPGIDSARELWQFCRCSQGGDLWDCARSRTPRASSSAAAVLRAGAAPPASVHVPRVRPVAALRGSPGASGVRAPPARRVGCTVRRQPADVAPCIVARRWLLPGRRHCERRLVRWVACDSSVRNQSGPFLV